MKRIKWMIGVLILIITGSLVSLNLSKKEVVYKSDLENVKKIFVDADVSNVVIVTSDSDLNVQYAGQKSFVGTSDMNIVYDKDQAIIKVRALQKRWMTVIPGSTKRGELLLNIPPRLLEEVQINTQNGNIDVKNLSEVNRLKLNSSVGKININSFKGNKLDIEAKNGSINIGSVDAEVNIKNRTGNLNSLEFTDIKGKNTIKLSNGHAKITLPNDIEMADLSLNIATKNGKISSENDKVSTDVITKHGAGQKLIQPSKGDRELIISCSVGSIKIK